MANSYFRNEPESVLRYRYCSFKARHSKGATKANWEHQASLAWEDAISEKLQREGATNRHRYQDNTKIPVSFYRTDDYTELNLRVLSKKTLPEINEAIKYWEDHLEQIDLNSLAKSVLRFQLRKLKTVKAMYTSTNR